MDSVFDIIKPYVWPFDYLIFTGTCSALALFFGLVFRRHVPALVLGFSLPPLIFCGLMAWGSIKGWSNDPALMAIEIFKVPPTAVILAVPIFALTAAHSAFALVSGRRLVWQTTTLYGLALGFAFMNSFVMYIMAVAK